MELIKLGRENSVEETVDFNRFDFLVNSLTPKKVSSVTLKKESVEISESFDKVKVLLEDGSEIEMNYIEYMHFPSESKEVMVFESEDNTLCIYYCFGIEVFSTFESKNVAKSA